MFGSVESTEYTPYRWVPNNSENVIISSWYTRHVHQIIPFSRMFSISGKVLWTFVLPNRMRQNLYVSRWRLNIVLPLVSSATSTFQYLELARSAGNHVVLSKKSLQSSIVKERYVSQIKVPFHQRYSTQKLYIPSRFEFSTTGEPYSLWTVPITRVCGIASVLVWIIALATNLARYGQRVHGLHSGWSAMGRSTVLILLHWPLQMENSL